MTFAAIKGKVFLQEPLSAHTTFRIGGPCRAWVEPRDERELKKILKLAASKKKKIFIIGMGSNILAPDKRLNGIVICLRSGYFSKLRFTGTKVIAGAGLPLEKIINLACRKGLGGIEGLTGIPGTLGGAIFMNAGYADRVADRLESVRVMDIKSGRTFALKKSREENLTEKSSRIFTESCPEKFYGGKKIKFNYRHSGLDGYIILEASFGLRKTDKKKLMEAKNRFLRAKSSNQPLASACAGCVFRNPEGALPAARYIDMLGFKGKKIGGAMVSEKHANFIINTGQAKARDVIRLARLIRKSVKTKFKIELIPEIVILN